jgi:hypothetical protein
LSTEKLATKLIYEESGVMDKDAFKDAGTSPPADSVEPSNLATQPTRGGAQ